MDFSFTAEEQAFRKELHNYLLKEVPDWFGGIFVLSEDEYDRTWEFTNQFARKLAQKGWLIRSWPREYGGQGASHMEQFILAEEMAYFYEPRGAHYMGSNWVGPTIIQFGTEEQKKQHLSAIANAEVIWCQGFSEPDAGSDLASLQTRAVEDGDDYILNGQKVWTSYAHHADRCVIGTRTDPDVPKHRGISYFLMDMKTPGITVRVLPSIFGSHFCEVFLDNVRVPKRNILGEKNRGWYTMMASMEYERGGYLHYAGLARILDELIKYTNETQRHGEVLFNNPLIRQKLAELAIGIRVTRALSYRVAEMRSRGINPGAEASIAKLYGSEFHRHFANTSMQIMGLYGQLCRGSKWAALKGRVEREYIWSPEPTVAGGTSEIQRNIIATTGLGLPR